MSTNRLYDLTVGFVRLYARLMLKMNIRYHAPIPCGAKLLVANHPSASDPFLIHLLCSELLSVLISGNAFAMPLFGPHIRRCNQIAVIPGQGQAMDQAQRCLESGGSVGIFPEGLVSPQSGYHPPHTGAARLALMTGVPVIPIGIFLPRERRQYFSSRLSGRFTAAYWYLRGPYAMTVGEPLHFEGDVEDENRVRWVTLCLMEKIHELAEESRLRLCPAPAGRRLPAM